MKLSGPETARAVAAPSAPAHLRPPDLTAELRRGQSTAELRPIQSLALDSIRQAQGGFFPIGVGHGKTLIALLAGSVLDCTLAVVLTKSGVVAQMQRDFATWSPHFRMPPNVRLVSYPTLSRPEQTETLSRLAELHGDRLVLVADECHDLKSATSARTRRVARLLEAYPAIRFVALSGTVTSRSLKDYAHLIEWALRYHSPIPRSGEAAKPELDAWARCLDPDGRPNENDWSITWPLVDAWGDRVPCVTCGGAGQGRPRPGGAEFCRTCAGTGDTKGLLFGDARREHAQRAMKRRLVDCAGVVATTDGSLGTSLVIRTVTPQIPEQIKVWLELIDSVGESPAGEVLPDDLTKGRARRNLACGYYQRWEWPIGPDGQAVVDEEWLRARRSWNRCVSDELEARAGDGYDSPFLVWAATSREVRTLQAAGDLSSASHVHRAWLRWEHQRHKAPPPSVAQWHSTYFIDALEALIIELAGRPAIVWYESVPVETALRQILGLRCYGAGTLPPDVRPGQIPPTVGMSRLSHGTGRNLQAWAFNIVLEPPGDAGAWEQMIGRTHRAGQDADEVEVIVFAHGAFGPAIKAARERAAYIERTTGNAQKLGVAAWIESEPVRARRAA